MLRSLRWSVLSCQSRHHRAPSLQLEQTCRVALTAAAPAPAAGLQQTRRACTLHATATSPACVSAWSTPLPGPDSAACRCVTLALPEMTLSAEVQAWQTNISGTYRAQQRVRTMSTCQLACCCRWSRHHSLQKSEGTVSRLVAASAPSRTYPQEA